MIPFNHKKPDFTKKFYTDNWGKFIKAWKWHNEKGEWIFCTVRYENNKGKNIIPFHYEKEKWKSGHILSDNRPLMDVHEIIKSEKEILLVEGEKCYDAAKKILFEDFNITTWCGGTGGIIKTDWKPLKNKTVYYWYDNDDPGLKTIEFLKRKLNKLILVHPPYDKPEKWDIANAIQENGWSEESCFLYIKQFNHIEIEENYVDEIKFPFQILGPGSGYHFFLSGESGQIFRVRKGGLNNSHLQELAPLDFWQDAFGYETKKGVSISWIKAQDLLIRQSNNKPPFDHNKIRGRGIWKEKGNLIIHTGEKLIIGDNEIDIKHYSPNGHVYERDVKKNIAIQKINYSSFDGLKILNCIDKLSINTDLEKKYLIGWCVLAFLCGALDWRSHIWITGPSGSGKSAIIKMIVLKMLGDFAFYAESLGTTGAGIVQNLNNDSFPVIHDEVDKTSQGYENLQKEIEIARSSSSPAGTLYKGTADQTGKRYTFNSMFCFSSVNVALKNAADKSRFSIINVEKNKNIEWKILKKEIEETFSYEMCEKIRSHFFYNWIIVKKTIKNFRSAAGVVCGDQRTGDQTGTLLAGAILLNDFRIYDYEESYKICKNNLNVLERDENMTDELELILKIFTTKIKYIGYDNRTEDTTLLHLLKMAAGEETENTPDPKAKKELYKYGINYNYDKKIVYIACNYEWLKEILKNTRWLDNYANILKRLDFADKKTYPCGFGSYYHGRAIKLDAKQVLRLSDDNIYREAGF